jgi:4-amino-4-deoxy-L-arabinose transferase-like glycosyltransferase
VTKSTPNRLAAIVVAILLLVCVVTVLLMACVPPVSRDALTHHLAVPKIWIEKGGMAEIPHLDFSYYPMNLNLLYAIPMCFGNDIIPKYIHFLFALATAGLVYSYLQQRTTRTLALMGALFFISTPVIVKLSISVYVDLGLIFFTWASIYYLFAWARSPNSLKYLIFSAIWCGLGLGTKYNGMIALFLLTLFVPILYIRAAGRNQFKINLAVSYPILFFLIAMTVFSPWMIKNYSLTGNPVYPLYKASIGNGTVGSEISNMSMKPWLQRKLIYRESAIETAFIPLRIFFQGKDDDPRYFDGKLNPILVLCPFLLLLRRRESNITLKLEQFLLASYSFLFVLYASFMVDMRIRYISPIIPPLVVLSVFGIQDFMLCGDEVGEKWIQRISRFVIVGLVLYCLFMNAEYVGNLFRSVNPVPYITGKTSREEYLMDNLPEYPAIQFANQIADDHVNILALFLGKRLYYFNKPVEFGTQNFARMVVGTADEVTLTLHLQKNGYTHCIIGINHFETWANQEFDDRQKQTVSKWLKNDCTLLFSKNGFAVFELISPTVQPINSGIRKVM